MPPLSHQQAAGGRFVTAPHSGRGCRSFPTPASGPVYTPWWTVPTARQPPMATSHSLPEILTALSSEEPQLRASGALHLSAFVDALSGEQARQLGEYMRSAGAVDLLAELLDDADPLLPQWVLGTLANLCSDAFDPGSAATKAILRDCNAMERLLRHLGSTDAATQLMATAALQNMCSDAELAATAVRYGAHTWLDALVCSDSASEQLKRFAAGALLNINDHPIPSSVDEGSGARPQTPSSDGEGSSSGASEGGTPRRKKKGILRARRSSRSVLPVESVPVSEGGEMSEMNPNPNPSPDPTPTPNPNPNPIPIPSPSPNPNPSPNPSPNPNPNQAR